MQAANCMRYLHKEYVSNWYRRWTGQRPSSGAFYDPCRLVSEQKEDIFTNDHYGDLAAAVSVWLFLKPAKKDQGRVVEWNLSATDTNAGHLCVHCPDERQCQIYKREPGGIEQDELLGVCWNNRYDSKPRIEQGSHTKAQRNGSRSSV